MGAGAGKALPSGPARRVLSAVDHPYAAPVVGIVRLIPELSGPDSGQPRPADGRERAQRGRHRRPGWRSRMGRQDVAAAGAGPCRGRAYRGGVCGTGGIGLVAPARASYGATDRLRCRSPPGDDRRSGAVALPAAGGCDRRPRGAGPGPDVGRSTGRRGGVGVGLPPVSRPARGLPAVRSGCDHRALRRPIHPGAGPPRGGGRDLAQWGHHRRRSQRTARQLRGRLRHPVRHDRSIRGLGRTLAGRGLVGLRRNLLPDLGRPLHDPLHPYGWGLQRVVAGHGILGRPAGRGPGKSAVVLLLRGPSGL